MDTNKFLALALSGMIGLAACSTGTETDTADTAVATEAADDTADAADDTADAVATDTDETADAGTADTDTAVDHSEAGGPGMSISAESVTTVDELVALIQDAYGDASLGLHRGHQPVESTLIDFLGITHDEMHVRMETQGQNLAAVATDLGLDPEDLIDALVATRSLAVENLLDAGTISQDEADAYLAALTEAFTYRVTWNGTDATPTFSGI